jgi:hypothetical protein
MGTHVSFCCFQILVRPPGGFGFNKSLVVNVTFQSNNDHLINSAQFSFDPPTVTVVNPKPYLADGQKITILGTNFGNQVSSVGCPVLYDPSPHALCRPTGVSGPRSHQHFHFHREQHVRKRHLAH